jgi:TonB family protein
MSLALETYRQDDPQVGSAISRREGVFLSLVVHAGLVALYVLAPSWSAATPEAHATEPPREHVNFVLMTPRVEVPAIAKPNVEHSDRDRRAASPMAAPVPANELPASVGNTIERTAATPPEKPVNPDSPPPATANAAAAAASSAAPDLNGRYTAEPPPPATAKPAGSGLGQSIRNLQQYLSTQNFNNPQGGQADPSADIQFDSKGVEFGPWIRRFLLQLKRNWFAPAIASRGCTTIQFYVHKEGRISDIRIVRPSTIEPFNTSAQAALTRTSPTLPLPPEYPDDRILFTVTFIYNERIGCT